MLRSFITDEDLKKYHPNLKRQLWTSQSDYSEQIAEALHIVLTDLNNRQVNPRLLMIPFDLLSNGTTANFATSITLTNSATGTGIQAGTYGDRNYRRLVFNDTNISGTWAITLQGSNDNRTFQNAGASLTATDIGEQSVIFSNQYKYYRYLMDEVANGSISFSAYLVEDIWDKLVIYKTFELIFQDFMKAQNDQFDILAHSYQTRYESELSAVKYLYDSDDNGAITDGETGDNRYYLTL